jgi:predicted MFS family arabinose efflux permease
MADVFPPEQRARAMGFIGMAFGIGFVFGPAIGGLLASDLVLSLFYARGTVEYEHGRLLIPGLFAALFSGAAFLLALFRLEESLPKERRAQRSASKSELTELFSALTQPGIGPMLLVYFVVVCGFANLESMFSQFNLDMLQLPHSSNAIVFGLIGLTLAAVQGGLIGRLTSKFGSARVLMFGLTGLSLALLAFGFQVRINPGLSPMAWLIVVSMLTSATFSLCNPSVLGIISSLAKAHAQGGTMGFTSSSATLGRIIGPLIGGLVYAIVGPEWPFVVGAVLIATALLVFVIKRPRDVVRDPAPR